jgi:hypothetical protein
VRESSRTDIDSRPNGFDPRRHLTNEGSECWQLGTSVWNFGYLGHLVGWWQAIGSVTHLLARVAKWQTRWRQVSVFVRTWGFKSPLAHQLLQWLNSFCASTKFVISIGISRLSSSRSPSAILTLIFSINSLAIPARSMPIMFAP